MSSILRVLIFFMLIPPICAFAQKDSISLNSIVEKSVKINERQPAEKLYLHFDKPYYALGDTIWFKAYLAANAHQPSPFSKIVYVEMIAGRDSLVETLKLPVSNSTAAGSIVLSPKNYSQGNYRIRAYTNWMFNFTDSYFFNKTLVVGDAIKKEMETQVQFVKPTAKNIASSTKITFRDENGKPYGDRKVSWKVVLDYDVVSKGKGKTDASGNLTIDIPELKKGEGDLSKGTLVATIEISEYKILSSSYPLTKAFIAKDLQFFPEGGDLIAGVPVKLAFKALKSDGLGMEVKGTITDNTGVSVAEFSSQHLGMGAVMLNPEAGKSYQANAVFADGSKAVYKLPEVKSSGVSLRVTNSADDQLSIRITANESFSQLNNGKYFYILARSGGIICYAAQFALKTQLITTSIPKDKFPAGIVQVSLLNTKGEELSERLTFVANKESLSISLKADKPSYASGQKVKISLNSKYGQIPALANLSLAVINETKVPADQDAASTILSSLLLNADLKGYIEKPNYYFNQPDQKKQDDLDLLLLTQGYRAFTYKEIVEDSYTKAFLSPEQGIEISGILRYNNGMPVAKGNVRLIIPDKSFGQSAVTDAEGRFRFSNVVFADSSKVTLSALNNYNSKNMVFTLDGTPYASISTNPAAGEEVLNIDSALNTYLSNSKKQYFSSRMLREVVIKSTVIQKKVSHSDYSALSGLSMMANHEISGDRFKGCSNFLQCLQGSAMGLVFDNNEFYITRNYNSGNKTPVEIYVKGMPVDVNYLNSVMPSEVESVEIFYNDGVSGINRRTNTSGVVVVNMREAPKGTKMKLSDLKDLFPSTNQITFNPKGYSKVKQFYVPRFDVAPTLNKQDLRTTILWNPAVMTDAAGNASVECLSADKGTYLTVVEGMDAEGRLGRQVFRFTVK